MYTILLHNAVYAHIQTAISYHRYVFVFLVIYTEIVNCRLGVQQSKETNREQEMPGKDTESGE